MKRFAAAFAALAATASIATATDSGFGDINLKAIKAGKAAPALPTPVATDSTPALSPAMKAAAPKEWTVMIFFNGKNNLETFVLKDINEMETVGSTSKINIVGEAGRMNGQEGDDNSEGDWTGARRYLITKDKNINKISSKLVQTVGNADMGSWKHLVEFARWAKTNYPAKRYMLIIWNHGSGWASLGKTMVPQNENKGISYDDETGNHITTTEMGSAFAQIGKIDLYASDACLMQDMGVVHQIAPYTEVIVGSEEIEPGDGYDYSGFFKAFAAKPTATPTEVGAMIVNSFKNYYVPKGDDVTTSTLQSAAVPTLLRKMDVLAAAILANNDIEAARRAAAKSIKYYYEDQKDLGDFAKRLMLESANPAVKQAASEVISALRTAVLSNAATGKLAASSGLAVYLPETTYDSTFDTLSMSKASRWNKLAAALPAPRILPDDTGTAFAESAPAKPVIK